MDEQKFAILDFDWFWLLIYKDFYSCDDQYSKLKVNTTPYSGLKPLFGHRTFFFLQNFGCRVNFIYLRQDRHWFTKLET